MPIEYTQLKDKPVPFRRCPNPGCACSPFIPFERGVVQSWWRKLLRRPYCAVICIFCHKIVGYERP